MSSFTLNTLCVLASAVAGLNPQTARAWPADSLTQVQVSPANAILHQGAALGVGGSSIHYWASSEGISVSRLRGLDPSGSPEPAWSDSGMLLEHDPRGAQDERIIQGPDGSVYVLWLFAGLDSRIRVQRFRSGQALWADTGVVVSRQSGSDGYHDAIPDGVGGLFVTWGTRVNFPTQKNIYAAHIDSNGVHQWSSDFPVCEAAGLQGEPRLGLDGTSVVVFWYDARQTSAGAYFAQRISALGLPLLPMDGIRALDDPTAILSKLVVDASGASTILYTTLRNDPSERQIYLCRLDSTMSAAPGWPPLGVVVADRGHLGELPSGLRLVTNGGVLVCWNDNRVGNIQNSPGTLWLQRFTSDGLREWPEERVGLSSRGGSGHSGPVAPDGTDGFFLLNATDQQTLGGPTILRVQRSDQDGAPRWGPYGVTVAAANSKKDARLLPDGSGGLFVTWLDDRFGANSKAIFAQHVNADGTLGGSVTATQASAIESSYENGCAHVVWHTSESAGMRFQVERAREGEGYEPIGEAWPDGRGLVTVRDCGLERGESYRYRLAWDEGGTRAHSSPVIVQAQAASVLSFSPPFPTPATSRTELVFSLPRASRVRLAVHDLAGRRVALILDGSREAGTHRRTWEPRDSAGRLLPPGAYTLTLSAAGETRSQRLIVVR